MSQRVYQHTHTNSTQTLLNSCDDDVSPAKLTYNTFQTHTANQTTCKPSSQQSWNIGQVISKLAAPALGLVLENKGNVARDHLASERTYLAYVRTSLACANAGVAIVQLFKLSSPTDVNDLSQGGMNLQRLARPIGVTMVLFGLLILAMGLTRFVVTQGALLRGIFPVARNSIAIVTLILGAVVSLVFAALLADMRG